MKFELLPEEHDILSKAIQKRSAEMSKSLGGKNVEPKAALFQIAELFLESDPVTGDSEKRIKRDDPLYTILYHQCPDCKKAHLPTQHGPVEIPREVVECIAGEADKVTISPEEEMPTFSGDPENKMVPLKARDKPNTPQIVRKVTLRDGRTCSNPMCGRSLGTHAHHIQFRSNGGRTSLDNETLLCDICHSLCHQRLLKVTGSPLTKLRWETKSDELKLGLDVALDKEFEKFSSIEEVRLVRESPDGDCSVAPENDESSSGDSDLTDISTYGYLIRALADLSLPKKRAEERVATALKSIWQEGKEVTEQEILFRALRNS